MTDKKLKHSENQTSYRMSHLSEDEKELAVSLYKAGIDFNACSPREAVEWHQEVASKGWAPAQYNLACCYANGNGIQRDMSEAAKWFGEAAKQGHPEAQCRLGFCYDVGDGVKQDKKEAVYWYRKSAAQGENHAQFNLGCCYEDGDGVKKDKLKAAKYFYKSARQGNSDAKRALKRVLDNDEN